MTSQILVVGSAVLAHGPFTGVDDESYTIVAGDGAWPKHVMEGWQIVDVDLPDDFICANYQWSAGTLIPSQLALAALERTRVAGINARIAELEAQNPFTPTVLRQEALIIRELIKTVQGSYPNTVGFNLAKQIDDQINALRAQI